MAADSERPFHDTPVGGIQSPVPGHQLPTAESEASAPDRSRYESDVGISLLDIAIVLVKHKKLIVGLPLSVATIAAGITLLLPNWYTATAKILPPQQSQSSAVAILGQLGVLGGAAGGALGIKNPNDTFIAMLKSRTVADVLIQKFDLKNVYDEDLMLYVRKELKDNTVISSGRDGVISIEVDDNDPIRAAALANAYVQELEVLTLNFAVSEAGKRRLFFEKQLQKAKLDLANAEIELQRLQEKTGIINPTGQAGLSVTAAAGLRAQITAAEVQLNTLRSFATDENPDLIRTQKALEGLRTQMARIGKASDEKGDVLVGIGKAPGASIEFIKKYREMKYYETLFELLAKQYEIAKIDEAKDATLIQILDKAVPPERKSKPKRLLMVLIAASLAELLVLMWAFVSEALQSAQAVPEQSRRLQIFRKYLLGR